MVSHQVVFDQGGLSSGWSLISVVSHKDGLCLIRVVFHKGFHCIYITPVSLNMQAKTLDKLKTSVTMITQCVLWRSGNCLDTTCTFISGSALEARAEKWKESNFIEERLPVCTS